MFSSIGWPEIFVIVLLGIIVIGPEHMPEVIKDVRAAIYAARKAINNAKAELNGEMSSITSEFDDIRGPLTQAAQWTRLGPKGAITKALFDGDDSAWDDFNPKKMAENVNRSSSARASTTPRSTLSSRSQSPGRSNAPKPPSRRSSPRPRKSRHAVGKNPPAAACGAM